MRRKQYESLKKMSLSPSDWCAILGVRVIDPDGWRGKDPKPFDEPVGLDEFVRRCWPSTLGFEEGALDLNDAENFLAEDGMC
jgi:hypothetical protein